MSSATRAACGLILTSLVATATALAQGTRAQFGVGASLTLPLPQTHPKLPQKHPSASHLGTLR